MVKVLKRMVKDKALDCVARNHHTSAQKDIHTAVINFKKALTTRIRGRMRGMYPSKQGPNYRDAVARILDITH